MSNENKENKENTGLRKFMSPTQRRQLGSLPTYHQNCIDACGVARPGKTARDRARGNIK